jgi:hypothetical protein
MLMEIILMPFLREHTSRLLSTQRGASGFVDVDIVVVGGSVIRLNPM